MKNKSIFKRLDIIFISILVIIFFINGLNKISYGLPYFVNQDELEFQSSTLSSLGFFTNYIDLNNYNPLYAPLINLIIILKFFFINEFLINSLTVDQVKLKIYFNPELFIFYGRAASLAITTFSIFFLYLIFKKLKINFFIYSVLLITFCTSAVVLNISTIMSKNSCNLLLYTLQLYFLVKYLFKIEKFNLKSYFIFGLLASLAWGVNYWPAFISIYAVFILHFKKFKLLRLHYLLLFLIIFTILGPIVNSFFVGMGPIDHITPFDEMERLKPFEFGLFLENLIRNIVSSLKIIYSTDKNIILLLIIVPLFFLKKNIYLKNEFLIILFLFIAPLFIFGISGNFYPQLRYFAGIISVIIILTAYILNELNKIKFKYLTIILLLFNFLFIYINIKQNIKIENVLSVKHSFINFNKKIDEKNIDRSKILYLVDLNFQESLKQNLLYVELYENDLIYKNNDSLKMLKNSIKKIKKINNTKNIETNTEDLKKDITFFSYTYLPIKDPETFFNFIKKDFDYLVLEESKPFYMSDSGLQNKLKKYVKENYLLELMQFDDNKIFLNNQQSIIHYYVDTLSRYDLVKNIDNKKLEVIYGINYSLYKLD